MQSIVNNSDSVKSRTGRSHADILKYLYGLLGVAAILLPLPFRQKGPTWVGWQATTLKETRALAYQQRLESAIRRGGNIGVLLESASGHLVAVDIDNSDANVAEWIDLNPHLSDTLHSRGNGGTQIWMQVHGQYLTRVWKLKNPDGSKYGEWRAGNGAQSVIWGEHPNSTEKAPLRYRRIVSRPARTVSFDSIRWPSYLLLPWQRQSSHRNGNTVSARVPLASGVDLNKRIRVYIEKIPDAISGQNGHGQTFSVAKALILGWGLSIEEAWPRMFEYNSRCEPPWTEKELAHKLSDAEKLAGANRAGYLRLGRERAGV
jgi:hypothetical protein